MRSVGLRVYFLLFFIVCLAVLINCQGGGGGCGEGSSSRSSGKSHCVGYECWKIFVVIGGCLCFSLCFCCCYKGNGRPKEINSKFVYCESSQGYTPVQNAFQTGMWLSRYYQHGSWHGTHQLHLSFNSHSMAIIGSGWDDVGEYKIDGIYSERTQRMGLTKYYKKGTGNAGENLGHSVTIQVTFKAEFNRFEGKWYVQTKQYHGEGGFVLKFDSLLV